MRGLGTLGWQRLIVILFRRIRVQGQVELIPPSKLKARLAQRIVAHLRRRVPLGQICRVGRQLIGDHADFYIVAIGQAEMLLGCDITEHRGAIPADLRRADAAGDMVISRRDVGGERPERVEGRFAARLKLLFHILLDLVHGHMPRPFDHHSHILCPGALGEFAQRVELGKLRFVIRVVNASRAQAIAE